MTKSKRNITILFLLVALLAVALLLVACKGGSGVATQSEILLPGAITTSERGTGENAATTADGSETEDGMNEDKISENSEDNEEDQDAVTEETDGEAEDLHTEDTDDEDIDEDESDEEDVEEEETEIRDGYTRVNWISAEGEWLICVHDLTVARGTIDDDSILVISGAAESRMEIWGKTDEYGHFDLYLYFDTLEGYREIVIRDEWGAIQIDLTAEELSLLFPTDSLEDSTPQPPVKQEGGEEEKVDPLDSKDNDLIESIDPLKEDPVEPKEDPVEPKEEPVVTNGGAPAPEPEVIVEPTTPLCPICGTELSDTSAHFVNCDHYAILPLESEAYDFLSALPGMKEDISVTALDEETEIYSFVLNYLTYEEAIEIRETFVEESFYSGKSIHIQKAIGSKVFTFDVDFYDIVDLYKVNILLRGFALD